MNILVDIGHPAHVHLFKETFKELKRNGHDVFLTVKCIPAAEELLNKYEINYLGLGDKKDSLFGKGFSQIKYNWKIFNIVRKNNIDLGVGSSITLAHISRLTKMKSIILDDDDDEVEPLFVKYAHPYCDALISPESLRNKRKKKDTIFYSGFHELAYLHPNRFKPEQAILEEVGLKKEEPFFIMRFNVFKAHHDVGVRGLSLEQKLELVKLLNNYGRIFITTEREIEPELRQYQLTISPEKIHSLIYYATMLIGDSQTMTSEACILGTPALKCNTFAGKLSVPNELENKYGLCYSYQPSKFGDLLNHAKTFLQIKNIKQEWKKKREKLLKEKIDVTAFIVWFIENYPDSVKIVRKNPDYQWKFK